VLIEATNLFMFLADYSGMKEFIEAQLGRGPFEPLLVRNLAIARQELGEPADSIVQTFESSLSLARDLVSGTEQEVANTALPYAAYLLGTGEYKRAHGVIVEGLRNAPNYMRLVNLLARVEREIGNRGAARSLYERLLRDPSPAAHSLGRDGIADLQSLEEFEALGVMTFSPTADG
jgi:hypothetical protein